MLVESFLTKIAAAVLKKASLSSALSSISTAVQICSAFELVDDVSDCLNSINDCTEFGIHALEVVSDPLTSAAVDQIFRLGSDMFTVDRTSSGVYITSNMASKFVASDTYGNLAAYFDYERLPDAYFNYDKL